MRLIKIFMANFAPDERLPSSATLIVGKARLDEVPGIRVCSGGDKLLDGFEVPRLQKRRRPSAAKTFPFPSLPFS